jgi:hypothetical protein
MPKPLSLSAKLERFPPIVIRLLARRRLGTRTVPLTVAQIAAQSGLSVGEINALSRLTSWAEVTVDSMAAFTRGCGCNLDDRDWLRKNTAYMAGVRSAPRYLRQSSDWETVFQPMIAAWLRHSP